MTRAIKSTALLVLLGLILIPIQAQAGWDTPHACWQALNRFCGEWWGDGYHSRGDAWSQPPKHFSPHSTYQPYYYPVQSMPVEVIQQPMPAPAQPHQVIYGVQQSRPVVYTRPN